MNFGAALADRHTVEEYDRRTLVIAYCGILRK